MQAIDVRNLRTKILRESQTAFAERFGVDQSAVARWEKDGLPTRGAARRAVEKLADEVRAA
jgi:DNA-binding transcriptional regulator YiaG